RLSIRNESTDLIFSVPPWYSLTLCLLIPLFGPFICFWVQGLRPEARVVNTIYFYFIMGTMYFSFSAIFSIQKKYPSFTLPFYIKVPVIILLLFIMNYHTSILRINNITIAYSDITSGRASVYNKERIERDEYLRNSKDDSCFVSPLTHIPESFFCPEIPRYIESKKDDSIWNMWCREIREPLCAYYHKKYIGLK
ncbi:MAG TPA: hypothetical protein VN922_22715, partial [Bacteroidia bacterium]|nr:hypothetical protein [Bacteroidia bacterium]